MFHRPLTPHTTHTSHTQSCPTPTSFTPTEVPSSFNFAGLNSERLATPTPSHSPLKENQPEVRNPPTHSLSLFKINLMSSDYQHTLDIKHIACHTVQWPMRLKHTCTKQRNRLRTTCKHHNDQYLYCNNT